MKVAQALTVAGLATAAVFLLSRGERAQPDVPAASRGFQLRTVKTRGPTLSCDAVDPSAKKGSAYKRVRVHSRDVATYRVWPDGGTEGAGVESVPLGGGYELVPGSCIATKAEPPGDDKVALEEQPCACRKATGKCLVLTDGGAVDAPKGLTLGPGYEFETWTGDGCQPKACTELAGVSSWPTNCPR